MSNGGDDDDAVPLDSSGWRVLRRCVAWCAGLILDLITDLRVGR
jgi:hypothetical protein